MSEALSEQVTPSRPSLISLAGGLLVSFTIAMISAG